jgi:hypothetical protein
MDPAPGRSRKRIPRLVWIVPVLALGATTVWWLARGPNHIEETKRRVAEQRAAAAAAAAALSAALAQVAGEPNPVAYVEARAGKEDPATVTELIQAYTAWASRTDALEARRMVVKRFLGHGNLKIGLEALLNAVAGDSTPRNQDPMWTDLVQGVAGMWDAVTISYGRDMVILENRPKPKDLLLESLANTRPDKIGDEQKNLLAADLIDLYHSASRDQKPALDRALTAMAGSDVVEALNGRGINEGSPPLKTFQKTQQELEAGKAQYKKVIEEIAKEDREAKEANAREAAKRN